MSITSTLSRTQTLSTIVEELDSLKADLTKKKRILKKKRLAKQKSIKKIFSEHLKPVHIQTNEVNTNKLENHEKVESRSWFHRSSEFLEAKRKINLKVSLKRLENDIQANRKPKEWKVFSELSLRKREFGISKKEKVYAILSDDLKGYSRKISVNPHLFEGVKGHENTDSLEEYLTEYKIISKQLKDTSEIIPEKFPKIQLTKKKIREDSTKAYRETIKSALKRPDCIGIRKILSPKILEILN